MPTRDRTSQKASAAKQDVSMPTYDTANSAARNVTIPKRRTASGKGVKGSIQTPWPSPPRLEWRTALG
ncbi:MAG: hypothetical protein FWG92_06625, partial [Leptospirales bacterium]|nr:hypothetical protein [Leptospirales bacterium]